MTNAAPSPVLILYFAWLRERAGLAEERVILPEGVDTVGALRAWLRARGGRPSAALDADCVRAAVNQRFARPEAPIAPGDEVAFFPPVTGG